MAAYGIAFSQSDIEAEIGEELGDVELQAMVSELEEAMATYFQRDLLEEFRDLLQSEDALEGEPPNPTDFEINTGVDTAGSFIFTRGLVESTLGFKIPDKAFGFVVEYFDRAFAKYFAEECERLFEDIEEIVQDFIAGN